MTKPTRRSDATRFGWSRFRVPPPLPVTAPESRIGGDGTKPEDGEEAGTPTEDEEPSGDDETEGGEADDEAEDGGDDDEGDNGEDGGVEESDDEWVEGDEIALDGFTTG